MTLLVLLLSVLMSVGTLAWGYAQAGWLLWVRGFLIFGAIWLVAVWQRWRWFAYVGLVFGLLAAALGLWLLDFPPGWMFAGAIGALLAFDLTDFRDRLRYAASDDERRFVEARHLRRLSLLALVGFALASLAMLIRVQFSFEWAALLSVIVALGLTQLIGWSRRINK